MSENLEDCGCNCLKNWQKWLEERERLQNYLGKSLDRQPADLVMNLDEELRMVKEEKTLIDYTKIETEFDYYRGNPNFWKLPLELFNKNDPCGRSYLFKPETLEEKGKVPTLERVGLPRIIAEEKHVYPRTRSLWNQWTDVEYRKTKMKDLKVKLENIQPHRPDFSELVVVGHKVGISNMTQESSLDPSSEGEKSQTKDALIKSEEVKKSKTGKALKVESQLSLVINGFQFKPTGQDITKVFLLAFSDFNIHSKTPAMKYLSIENKGSVPLKLSFKQIEPYNLFHDLIPYRQKGIVFFFERSGFVLIPGDKVDLPFRFKTSKPGNYEETWEIFTTPKLWKPLGKVLLKLKGFADVTDAEKLNQVSSDLERRVRDRMVKDTISELLYNVETKDDPVANLHFYDETQIFETINSEITPYNSNPKYRYNEIVVEKLKSLYETVRLESDPAQWNFSVEDLRMMVLQHDLHNKEGEIKMKEFEELVNRLERPLVTPCDTKQLYTIFFGYLCSCFTQICNEIFKLQEDLGVIFQPKYPTEFGSTCRLNSYQIIERKASETKVSNKKRNSKAEESTRKLRKDSRANSSQRLLKRNSGSRRKRSTDSCIEMTVPEETTAVIQLPECLSTQFRHNLYVIFYTNLCKTIDAIESACASKEESVPHSSIQRLGECKDFEQKYYHRGVVNVTALVSEILSPEAEKKPPTEKEPKEPSIAGILRSYSSKLISYPETVLIPLTETKPAVEIHSTSTLEGGKLDPNWLDFKDIGAQTSEASVEYDLVQKVEILQEATSLQDVEYNRDAACQKNEDEHVSDEEYFYTSEEDT